VGKSNKEAMDFRTVVFRSSSASKKRLAMFAALDMTQVMKEARAIREASALREAKAAEKAEQSSTDVVAEMADSVIRVGRIS